MKRRIHIGWLGLLLISLFGQLGAQPGTDPAIVFVEGYDGMGEVQSRVLGVVVKEGFVVTNYHAVAGMSEIGIFTQDSPQKIVSNGYLSVDEKRDVIVLAAPGLDIAPKNLTLKNFPSDGEWVDVFPALNRRQIRTSTARRIGQKNIFIQELPQLLSDNISECTSGPIFQEGEFVGMVVAGYLDDQYYGYALPAYDIRRLLNRSFIIKDFNSLADQNSLKGSYFQISLVENLSSVIWLSLPEATELAPKNDKMILINVFTEWAGWSKLMDKNTYSNKRIIRYINENFYAVRLNAETDESIPFNNLTYKGDPNGSYHTLAYSLLEGNMDFPSTVFLDENLTVLLVVPGYMNARRMEVVLHYFSEKAYKVSSKSFQQFESEYWSRKEFNR